MGIIKKQSVSQQIIEYILGQIEEGKLRPGDRLMSEREFAELLGVSRVPLREAISALSALGIVESRQGEGTFVNKFNPGTVGRILYIYTILDDISAREILQTRCFLESAVARIAVVRCTLEELEKLRELVEDFEGKYHMFQKGDVTEEDMFDCDNLFHDKIASISGNRFLMEFLKAVRKPVNVKLSETNSKEHLLEAFEHSMEFHRKIYEAIVQKDEDQVYKLMFAHVTDIAEAVENNRRRNRNADGANAS